MGAPAWNEPEDRESNRGWLVAPGADRELLLMEGRAMMSVSARRLKLVVLASIFCI